MDELNGLIHGFFHRCRLEFDKLQIKPLEIDYLPPVLLVVADPAGPALTQPSLLPADIAELGVVRDSPSNIVALNIITHLGFQSEDHHPKTRRQKTNVFIF